MELEGKKLGKKNTTLVLTYNNVRGYPSGTYKGKSQNVVIHSQDKRYYKQSAQKLSELLHSMYGKVKMNSVKDVVVYAGLNALNGALSVATNLAHDSKNVRLIACDCNYSEKKRFAENRSIGIEFCECGGEKTLGKIVNELLEA